MLNIFLADTGKKSDITSLGDQQAIWYQLFCATPDEKRAVEETLKISIPTPEEMKEIETSNRLYVEDGVVYMTIDIVHIHSGDAILVPITFILNKHFLVTNHSSDYAPFEMFTNKFQKEFKDWSRPELIFIGILEMIVEKRADNLEKIGINIEEVSREIFTTKHHRNSEGKLHRILASIGKNNDIATKERESLVTIERLLTFFSHQEVLKNFDIKKITSEVHSLQRDVEFMAGHVSFLADKITFLLDATLGYINIEQNAIIKIFSVAAVIFLPPTLIASVYGMNFMHMPELSWFFGYPLAIVLMILSASIPYYLFRRKGWL